MKLPRFSRKDSSDKLNLNKEDERVFAEASELAVLRLEQCIVDMRITMPAMREALHRYEHPPVRKFTNLF